VSLFQIGSFKLNSGLISPYKIDCDWLTDQDIDCLAMLLVSRVKPFSVAEGVPTGGMRLAKAMQRYANHGGLLIVDDVFTTGGSMTRQKAGRIAQGAVIFAREACPEWIVPLFRMS